MKPIQKLEYNTAGAAAACYHCGEPCPDSAPVIGEKRFCCIGCKTVFEILEANDMCTYYSLDDNPGISPAESGTAAKFQYLDDDSVRAKILDFSDGNTSNVSFYIPSIHCSSCIWLLESLYRLNPAIQSSKVDYLKKQLTLSFDERQTSLRKMVELLSSIGYEPQINMDSLEQEIKQESSKQLYLKIGIAGFCFANIMLLSFPEYLSGGKDIAQYFKDFFGYLSILLALPVFFYSSVDYFKSAMNAWKQKMVNMDVPISLGILTLFLRSIYDIVSGTGTGYMDSFTGLVFLLLIGKLFEKKTYDTLSFERDYKSYFPVSVTIKTDDGERIITLDKLQTGQRMVIRSQELIPADAIMINGEAYIDYSFVTGESTPVKKVSGEIIYAGGKQIGGTIEIDVVKDVSQSYLTQLWNDEAFAKDSESRVVNFANRVSRYFTIVVISIAAMSAIYWLPSSLALALNAFTAVLIVACPCALALSTPFTLGNTIRIFGKNKFYLKRTSVIEALAKINTVVFDKTGTLTRSRVSKIEFVPDVDEKNLSPQELIAAASLSRQSSHPLSQQIFAHLNTEDYRFVEDFQEFPGKGIQGRVNDFDVKLGSAYFIIPDRECEEDPKASHVHISLNDEYKGYFKIENNYRRGLAETISGMMDRFKQYLLTGDNDSERQTLLNYFKDESALKFEQSPFDKLDFIKELQTAGNKVLMIGDGLNDAGALKQSDAGISISDDINTFSPSSDAILDGEQFNRLTDFLHFSRQSLRIILASFVISFIYNFAGLYFAVQGTLSPLIAAILMPASSITIIVFTTGTTTLLAKKYGMWKMFRS